MTDRDPLTSRFDALRDSTDLASPGGAGGTGAAAARARGDRLRRRRQAAVAGAAAVAVVAVAVPLGLLGGSEDRTAPLDPARSPDPSPTQVERTDTSPETSIDSPPSDLVSTIPADFPLAAGWPEAGGDVSLEGPSPGVARTELSACGVEVGTLDGVVAETSAVWRQPAEYRGRSVLLFDSVAAARAASQQIRTVFADCPSDPDSGLPLPYLTDVADGPFGEDSWVAQRGFGNPAQPGREQVGVARVAHGLLIDLASDEGTDAAELAAQQREALRTPYDALTALLSDDPGATGVPDATGGEPDVTAVPVDLDLEDYTDGTGLEGGVTGPAADAPAVLGAYEPCGVSPFPSGGIDGTDDGATERWAVESLGPEIYDARELRVYPDAETAVQVVSTVQVAAAECGESGTGAVWTVLDGAAADTGYAGTTVRLELGGGISGGIWQLTRVGRAVLVTRTDGEGGEKRAEVRSDLARRIAPSLCPWTADGC